MNSAAWLLAAATLGVDYGWRLDANGQLEYIVQIPASQLETLRDSPEGATSNIPPELVRHVKRIRIVVGNDALPRDPLPAFPTEGAVTPINVGASRVNPAAGEFPLGQNAGGGFDQPLQSSVTPLDSLNAPANALPGPSRDGLGEAGDLIQDMLPIPPIPRATDRIPQFDSLAATQPSVRIQRDAADGNWRPNVSAPDTSDTWPSANRTASFGQINSSADPRSLPRRDLTTAWTPNSPYGSTKEPPYAPLLLTVCALCLSIGGNVYLGWIAWGYYLRYRESFESWRSGLTSRS
jgi:hypothetical protein